MSNLISTPPQEEFIDQRSVISQGLSLPSLLAKARLTTAWTTFFSNAYEILNGMTLSGVSANRPTKFLYVSRRYFDTSLGAHGKPIWISSVNSAGVATWIDSQSNIV